MSDTKPIRLIKAAKTFNVGKDTIIDHLKANGFEVEDKPTTKLSPEMYDLLLKEFKSEMNAKEEAEQITLGIRNREDVAIESDAAPAEAPAKEEAPKQEEAPAPEAAPTPAPETAPEPETPAPAAEKAAEEEKPSTSSGRAPKLQGAKVLGKIDLDAAKPKKKAAKKEAEKPAPKEETPAPAPAPEAKQEEVKEKPAEQAPAAKKEEPKEEASKVIKPKLQKLEGPKVLGKIDLSAHEKKKSDKKDGDDKKRKRKRIASKGAKVDPRKEGRRNQDNRNKRGKKQNEEAPQVSEKEIEEKIKATMAKMAGGGGKNRQKLRRNKRAQHAEIAQKEEEAKETGVLEVTEFVTVSELASMMDVPATQVIGTCMSLGVIVSINQRIDAEIIELVASEFGWETKFIDLSDNDTSMDDEEDAPEDLSGRAPIVTIMGHVDHGKTSLLDYIRNANVVAKEAGGITQHIGAYEVQGPDGRPITFLDTPGHEAFTAMRARGAKVTDVAVIVVAADDGVMPQTKEAISHAQSAGVPMIFAINKIDKDGANPNRIKEELSQMNILVEEWGGEYQSQELSAKKGINIDALLEKILLQAEMLDLKANADKNASGSIVEASLDKGRGYVATMLVQGGTLKQGDIIVSGAYNGKVKAMFNHHGKKVKEAGPSQPVQILGLNGAPTAGERFKVFDTEQEAKTVANKRSQLEREQGLRTQKHITLDEIGRRLALGTFKELNIIIKGDVDGSIEALADSLLKLSTDEIQVNIIHKAVGQISESDVLLASASDAIICGFQVRPSAQARKLAENENIEIRQYSVIYTAIEEVKAAMEGMLEPTIEEKVISNIEILEVFKISKVGTIAGCMVLEGKMNRNAKVRIIRDGIVVHDGELASLKRYKDDVKEAVAGQECGLNIKNFNDIKVGDIIEAYEEIEIKRTL